MNAPDAVETHYRCDGLGDVDPGRLIRQLLNGWSVDGPFNGCAVIEVQHKRSFLRDDEDGGFETGWKISPWTPWAEVDLTITPLDEEAIGVANA